MLSSGGGRRETASGFYPWGKVDSPRKRVAEWLCGWRHGNSFPMTQSAQSHRQMRSIPLCSKAVFYVFVFDSIHDSATMHNLSPVIFHWATGSPYCLRKTISPNDTVLFYTASLGDYIFYSDYGATGTACTFFTVPITNTLCTEPIDSISPKRLSTKSW